MVPSGNEDRRRRRAVAAQRSEVSVKRRLMFYTTSLSGGGAERVWAVLASELAHRGHDVTLVVDFAAEENRAFLAPEVKVEVVGSRQLRSIVALKALIERVRPDLVLTALGGCDIKALLATLPFGGRRIVMSYHGYYTGEGGLLTKALVRLAALWTRMTAATVCVSDDLRHYLIRRWHARADRLERIYNPIVVEGVPSSLDAATLAGREPLVLAVGRLVEVKDYTFLVRAFARMRDRSAKLAILGQGEQHDAIEAEARRLGVADRVVLPGYVDLPWAWYARARCFALTSRFESFGNVVVEALAHGLPVVTTPCGGPIEIVSDPRFGEVVPFDDEEAWARALDTALAAPGDPTPRMRRAADFGVAAITDRYEALIERVLARVGPAH